MLYCKCLNIGLDVKNSKLEKTFLTSTTLESHPFFAQGVIELTEPMLVTKELAALTLTERIEDWNLEFCQNCAMYCFAQSQESTPKNLINANLISDPNIILGLRKHEDYSPVFRIVINPMIDRVAKKLDRESVQAALSGLQHHLGFVIKKQAEKTDDTIRIFTDQQYEKLTAFQNRAMHDHGTLVRLLNRAEAKELVTNPAVNPTTPTKATPLPKFHDVGMNQPKNKNHATSAAIGIAPRRPVTRSRSLFDSLFPSPSPTSFDAEGVFHLEEMDDSPYELVVSEGESDTDHDDSGSHDEGIDIHLKKTHPSNMARSLPVNVPAFGHFDLQTVEFDSDALDQQPTPRDIAASIKALAQSQRGESVFGDLPRPRFSTRI